MALARGTNRAFPMPLRRLLNYTRQPHPWWRRCGWGVIVLAALLGAARLAAPFVIRHGINQRLGRIDGYHGGVADVDLQLWRGAYRIDQLELQRRVGDHLEPFLEAREIDFSLAWRELVRGRVLSDIKTRDVTLTFVPAPEDVSAAPVDEPPWQDVIADLFPIEITHFAADRGSIRLQNPFSDPPVDLSFEGLSVVATGLRNRPDEEGTELPAVITATGTTVGGGRVRLDVAADPLARQPRFELQLKVDDVHLPALNDYLMAHANVDVSRGQFSLVAEMSAKDGAFEGYVKPFFDEVSFADLPGQEKPVVKKVWQTLVSALVTLVKNKPRDQLATRIPFSGEVGDPDVGFWATVANLLRHGFVQALSERLEGLTRLPSRGGEAATDNTTEDRSAEPPAN